MGQPAVSMALAGAKASLHEYAYMPTSFFALDDETFFVTTEKGLCKIGYADLDIDTPIDAYFELPPIDFNSVFDKQVRYFYITVECDGPYNLHIGFDDDEKEIIPVRPRVLDRRSHRDKVAFRRSKIGAFLNIGVSNFTGTHFAITRIDALVQKIATTSNG